MDLDSFVRFSVPKWCHSDPLCPESGLDVWKLRWMEEILFIERQLLLLTFYCWGLSASICEAGKRRPENRSRCDLGARGHFGHGPIVLL